MINYLPFCPIDIRFGSIDRAVASLEQMLCDVHNKKIVLMASKRQLLALNNYKAFADFITKHKPMIYSDIPQNPEIRDVCSALRALQGTALSTIIAVGGGSCIDLAKAISALFDVFSQEEISLNSVRAAIKGKAYLNSKKIDVIAMPSTAGTGSEVTKWATIWDMEGKEKLSIDDVSLFPRAALVVPALTYSMPNEIIASSGLDALSHAMEAFWAKAATPLSRALSIAAIEKIAANLPLALKHQNKEMAQKEMCLASLLAGLAFSITRTTACHSISYPLTMLYDISHGFAAAITLFSVAKRNMKALPEIQRIFDIFGAYGDYEKWLNDALAGVQTLRLSAFGIKQSDLTVIAGLAFTAGRMDNNAVLFSEEEVLEILQECL